MLGPELWVALAIWFAVTVIIVVGSVWLLTTFWSTSIVFSRITFSLLIAVSMNHKFIFVEGKMNFWIWAFMSLGVILLFSLLPRVNVAIKFFCTLVIAVLASEVAVFIVGAAVGIFTKQEFVMTMWYEIILKIVCAGISFSALHEEIIKGVYGDLKNKILIYVEKILAALIYGVSFTFLCMSMNQNWQLAGWIHWAVLIVGAVITYFADKFLIDDSNL